MDRQSAFQRSITRRELLGRSSLGLGTAALAALLGQDSATASSGRSGTGGVLGGTHFAPRAKRVIYMLHNGAPSQVDLFDHKPQLKKMSGQPLPDSVRMGQRLTTMTSGQKELALLPGIAPFRQHGQCGMWLSDFLPHTASIADDICLIKSMHTESINHAPGLTFFLTGSEQPGRPSFGAWLSYGLGSVNDELPTFCVMTSVNRNSSCGQIFYDWYWGSGFLPSRHQGVKFRGDGDPVLYISDPPGMSRQFRRGLLNDLGRLNQLRQEAVGDPEIATRIGQYEMAYKMQTSVPELADVNTEPQHILDLYGPDVSRRGSFAYNCLLARRLAEKGVRFIQLMHAGWDQHNNLSTGLKAQCQDTDQAAAALVTDLKQRGLLEDTLIIWGAEFGRTVYCQGNINDVVVRGRDHHPRNFCIWMTGGGIRPGMVYGDTDDFSYNTTEKPVHVHDWQATVLRLLGIDHERLTFRFQGRDFRLTDVHGKVVQDILA